nr:isocitrate dehydrogenase phosphatase [Raoultella sp. NCTC 9187]
MSWRASRGTACRRGTFSRKSSATGSARTRVSGPLLEEMHADLLRADYWRELQTRIRNGHVEDVYAYRRRQRFCVRYGAMQQAG